MITNKKNDRIKFINKLQQKARFRKEQGLFVCEGVRLVTEVPIDKLKGVYYTPEFFTDKSHEEYIHKVKAYGIPVYEIDEAVMESISDVKSTQGLLAVVSQPGCSISDILKASKKNALIVVLCGLQDPGNLGTIIRTAEAAGAGGIIASADTVDIYSPKVVRSTMGSIFRLPYAVCDDMTTLMPYFAKRGVRTYSSVLDDCSMSYDLADFTKPAALLVGNEGNGIPDDVIRLSDEKIHIPMAGRTESLNAAVACSVILFEALRQRRNENLV